MFDNLLAQKLCKRMMKQFGYNINIMNDKGIIIASGDSTRIGSFHEIAYRIIQNNIEMDVTNVTDVTDQNLIGVKSPGVNMPIIYDSNIIGVIGISGDPEELLNFAYIVKLAIEIMIEHELYKEQIRKKQVNKNGFVHALLYENPANINKIEEFAKKLHHLESIARIPILIKFFAQYDLNYILKLIKKSPSHLKQDISLEIDSDHIVVFKSILNDPMKNFKKDTLKYINDINDILTKNLLNVKCLYYIGTVQNKYELYRCSFQHCKWLENYLKSINSPINFFTDFISTYFQSLLPSDELENVFSIYKYAIDSIGKDLFIELLDELYKNNMNINDTAKKLYVHRNTIFYRLNKIREQLGVDPINNINDSQFLFQLLNYYKKLR